MFGLSAVGGFFGRMFGTEKALGKMMDAGIGAVDKMFYTDQEKAENRAAAVTEFRGMVVGWMETTKGQNLARRFLAMMIAGVWLFQYMAKTALGLIAVWVSDPVKFQESAVLIGESASAMNGAMMLILGFYFAAPHLDKIIGPAMSKFGKGV